MNFLTARQGGIKGGELFDRIAWILFFVGLICGAMIRLRLPPVPLADPDSWGYLSPALSWLSGHGFNQNDGRSWLYPAFIAGVLKMGGSFIWVSRIQRILGLFSVVLFWIICQSWRQSLSARANWCRILESIVLSGGLVLYATNPDEAIIENSLRPEGLFSCCVFVTFLCFAGFCDGRWRRHDSRRAILFGAGSLVSSYALILLKPSWGFAFAVPLVLLWLGAFWKGDWKIRWLPLFAAGVLTACLIAAPRLLKFQADSASKTFLPLTLVCVHAEEIVAALPSPDRPDSPPDPSGIDRFYRDLKQALVESKTGRTGYRVLGFNPDYIMYKTKIFEELQRSQRWSPTELSRFCYGLYWRAWLDVPWRMAGKVIRQLSFLVNPNVREFYSNKKQLKIGTLVESADILPSPPAYLSSPVLSMYQTYLDQLQSLPNARWHLIHFQALKWIAFLVAHLSPFIQVTFFICWAIRLFRDRVLELAPLIAGAIASSLYGNVLTIALVHSLDVTRYRLTYLPVYLMALSMMVVYISAVIGQEEADGAA